jgi:hypothetical protein
MPKMPSNRVFWYIPNVIGYARVLLMLGALYHMPLSPAWAMALYASSALLDAVDGVAARYFGQSRRVVCVCQCDVLTATPLPTSVPPASKFGAVLVGQFSD